MLVERLQRCAMQLDAERHAVAGARGLAVGGVSTEDLARWSAVARGIIEELARTVQDIEREGAQLKDIQLGLVDFPAEVEGQPALLCWQFGETEVAFWHRETEGLAGRRPLAGASGARVLQ